MGVQAKITAQSPPTSSNEAVKRYTPLVRSIARRLSMKLPKHYDFNDLISDGMVGLLLAIERFDPTRGVKFETFATYYIKGAILDNLPKLPKVPKAQEEVVYDSPDDVETDSANLFSKVTNLAYSYILSLDAPSGSDGDETFNLLSQLGAGDTVQRDIEFEQLQKTLTWVIEQLPHQERTTLKLYYFQKLPFNEIGRRLGLSESWVSRIHKRALEQLRVKLGKKKSIDDFLTM
ncbi:MAG: sigma-70 family RNA polymerase sigma factor [Candidatus Sericytochromatia bacterium]|nr:sigma-70 family RNA polymerase sigma factor [Candidatus Sericytochromatia bacterium]